MGQCRALAVLNGQLQPGMLMREGGKEAEDGGRQGIHRKSLELPLNFVVKLTLSVQKHF